MKFIIVENNNLIGMCGHLTITANSDVTEYINKFGFNEADDAVETAKAIGIKDAKIVAIKAGDKFPGERRNK